MANERQRCPDCDGGLEGLSRRHFLQTASCAVAATASAVVPLSAAPTPAKPPETLVKALYDSLDEKQRKVVCFAWDHKDKKHGLLRTRTSNNWLITPPPIKSDFYTKDQQALVRQIFEGLVSPDWIERFDKQFKDDMGGFAVRQAIALFGKPGDGKFEFVLTGRHGTVRCDGNSAEHVAFGGPIVYGHAASGYYEKTTHPGNVFWHQALAANKVFTVLDGKQREKALRPEAPDESEIDLKGAKGKFEGVPIAELSRDQKELVQNVLQLLIEPYRQADRDEALQCLKKQGGLDKCYLAFYKADDLGTDEIWDNWRLEGPAFVWHYRGAPHVHVWVNVADDPGVELNSINDSGPLRQPEKK